MAVTRNNGVRLIGIIFLALGLFKFLNGTPWVVWIILGTLFMVVSKSNVLKGQDAANRDAGGQG